MLSIVLFLGVIGFLNPEKRSNILSLIILCYIIMGLAGGYISAQFYKSMNGVNWLKMSLLTSVLFPDTLFFGYVLVNIILSSEKSIAEVNITDLASLLFLWVFCTLSLILIGTFLGIKIKKRKMPYKVNAVPRQIPRKPWYLHYRYLSCITGLICFITILFELNYIMNSLWKHELYFVLPFLLLSVLFFVIVSGEVSIIVVFLNLCYGNYNWWWKSFLKRSSPVIYNKKSVFQRKNSLKSKGNTNKSLSISIKSYLPKNKVFIQLQFIINNFIIINIKIPFFF